MGNKAKKWGVLGAGLSGLEAARLLRKQGKQVTLIDRAPLSAASHRFCQRHGINSQLEPTTDVPDFDGILVSPGIPLNHKIIESIKSTENVENVEVCGEEVDNTAVEFDCEIDLSLRNYRGKIIGITGTNGKSTVVTMIQHILTFHQIKSSLAGNIGTPPSKLVSDQNLEDIMILELSSYQLEHSQGIPADFIGVTSFSSDHLARHGAMRSYFEAKWNLVRARFSGENFENQFLRGLKKVTNSRLSSLKKSEQHINTPKRSSSQGPEKIVCVVAKEVDEYRQTLGIQAPSEGYEVLEELPWLDDARALNLSIASQPHNLRNAHLSAKACCSVSHLKMEDCLLALRSFNGLPHRMEECGVLFGRRIINDSKATNVNSVLTLLSCQTDKVCLLLGGESKGTGFKEIEKYHSKISLIAAFGQAAEEINDQLGSKISVRKFGSLSELLNNFSAIIQWSHGDVLFSPGCASFDEFHSFEERGDFFKVEINKKLAQADQITRKNGV